MNIFSSQSRYWSFQCPCGCRSVVKTYIHATYEKVLNLLLKKKSLVAALGQLVHTQALVCRSFGLLSPNSVHMTRSGCKIQDIQAGKVVMPSNLFREIWDSTAILRSYPASSFCTGNKSLSAHKCSDICSKIWYILLWYVDLNTLIFIVPAYSTLKRPMLLLFNLCVGQGTDGFPQIFTFLVLLCPRTVLSSVLAQKSPWSCCSIHIGYRCTDAHVPFS